MHCTNDQFTIGKLWVTKNGINESPEYQRESAIWSKEKQQLFIDSILNGFDVPKLYFHDQRPDNGIYEYSVVDGKQRLHAIWEFLTDNLPLADDFKLAEQGKNPPIKKGTKFSELDDHWKESFKAESLTVVLIQNAKEDDIEELFSRLNNGEPLNAAEKRNAMTGDMSKLIREVTNHDFFKNYLSVGNKRYQHYEIAAKLLILEKNAQAGGGLFSDLKKRFLDAMVLENKKMTAAVSQGLTKRVFDNLNGMNKVFSKSDPLLNKQAYPPLYYVFCKKVTTDYAHKALNKILHEFIEGFHVLRQQNLNQPEDDRDPVLIEFGRLMQQGTNDLNSIKDRTNILIRYLLQENPDLKIKDKTRHFSDEERVAIWILGGKKCAECAEEIELEEMEADHHEQWAHGGETTLENGRSLCGTCNKKLAQKIH